MSTLQKIALAITILHEKILSLVYKIEAEIERGKDKIVLNDGRILFIKYNDFGEYGYQVQYSDQNLDRIRYDNFDTN